MRCPERQGLAVVGVAVNGTEALRQARELRSDMALVDISLGAAGGATASSLSLPFAHE